MDAPEFDDVADPSCTCLPCVSARRLEALALRTGGSPVRRARRTAVTFVTAGFVAAGVGPTVAHVLDHDKTLDENSPRQPLADGSDAQEQLPPGTGLAGWDGSGSPQGNPGPLRFGTAVGTAGKSVASSIATPKRIGLDTITRQQILDRARSWADAVVPYSQSAYHNGYRTDCSGYVSMVWGLSENAWTGNLADYAVPISRSDLQPGDILLFHNAANPVSGSHVTIFEKWADSSHTSYVGYEQTPPGTKHRTIPYAYFTNSSSYKPYRYKNVTDGGGGGTTSPGSSAFPGVEYFGPGKSNAYVTQLGQALVAKGYGMYYSEGPGPEWGSADQNATAAFQRDQGWTGSEADGIPGPDTWSLLMSGSSGGSTGGDGGGSTPATPPFPGVQYFGPGKSNAYITQLGTALVAKGYGRYYSVGPGPSWGSADRNATAAFQRAQGWTGSDADGIPGPDTWDLLMR